jgi:perosamine synthetase
VPGITLNAEPAGTKNSYWMTTAVWDRSFNKSKNEIVLSMRNEGVDVRPFFHPLSSLPAYQGITSIRRAAGENVTSYDLAARAVNLPSGFGLTRNDIIKVRQALCAALHQLPGGRLADRHL